jgi:hypothetical protein
MRVYFEGGEPHLQKRALALNEAHSGLDVAVCDFEIAVAFKVLDEPFRALLFHLGRLLGSCWRRCPVKKLTTSYKEAQA